MLAIRCANKTFESHGRVTKAMRLIFLFAPARPKWVDPPPR